MRRLQCNHISLILTGILLQIIASEFYYGADCFELQKLKIHDIVEPLLNKLKKSDIDGCSLLKIGKSILSSLSEKTVGFLECLKEDTLTDSHAEISTQVNNHEDNELFFNSKDDPEPPKEEEIVGASPPQKTDSKKSSDPFNISVLKGLKIMFTIPIKILHPKPSKKQQEPDADYDDKYYEPFT